MSDPRKVIGGIIIPQRPPIELQEAAMSALLAIAAWQITDDRKPYADIGPDLRKAFHVAHDQLVEALPKQTAAMQFISAETP